MRDLVGLTESHKILFHFYWRKKIDFSDMKMCSRNIKKVKKNNHFNISFQTNFYSSLWTDQLIFIIIFQNPFGWWERCENISKSFCLLYPRVYKLLTHCLHVIEFVNLLFLYLYHTHIHNLTPLHTRTHTLSHTHTYKHTHTHTDQNWTHSLWRNIVRHITTD